MKKVTNFFQSFLFTCCIVLASGQMAQAAVKYVRPTASGTGDGSSWANASADLQAMIDAAAGGDQVWVAAGTYKPTSTTDRTISFIMKDGVAIYGGFPGNPGEEGNFGLRNPDPATNGTTLSGDIDGDNTLANNSYHVILNNQNGLNSSAVLDGFTISGGNANNPDFFSIHRSGGGMYNSSSSPTVTNCSFSGNTAVSNGGGMYNLNSSSSPIVTNCSFSGNSAYSGGGIYNSSSSPTVTNCSFSGNSAYSGGGMYNNSSPTVTNCSFSGNSASNRGGGMHNTNSYPTVTNCSFSGNLAGLGGGMSNNFSAPTVTNCSFSGNSASSDGGGFFFTDFSLQQPITLTNCSFSGNSATYDGGGVYLHGNISSITNCVFWGNSSEIFSVNPPTVTHSIVQGGYAGTGNLNVNPLFVSQPPIGLGTSGDLRLQQCSRAIDAGDNAAIPAGVTTDLDGQPRQYNGGTVDMGAYERQAAYANCCPASGSILYVNQNATGGDSGTSWEHAFTDLQDALSSTCPGITEIWVAAGTYKPTSTTDRTISFIMKNGVTIYGGFPNSGNPTFGQRNPDPNTNGTTLSGDIDGDNTLANNSYHVILNNNNGLNSSAVLDGFTISGGNANNSNFFSIHRNGGGMYNSSSSPLVVNCSFSNNSAFGGAGMYNLGNNSNNSSPKITNSYFFNNAALGGAGMMNIFSDAVLTNCSFFGNSANNGGGGILSNGSHPIVINCSFSGNSASFGGGLYNSLTSLTVTNSILWGNSSGIENNYSSPTVTYSIVQGGYAGTGNLNVDPLFVSQPPIGLGTTGDLHLQACSPAIDAGTNIGAPANDLDGNPRPFNSGIADMGAYEFQGSVNICDCYTNGIIYVDADATGANNGTTWANAYNHLQDALSSTCPGITEIWVAAGTYKPTSTTDRTISFIMKNGVTIYGGFPNSGNPTFGQRNPDPNTNGTTLSGEIGAVGNADNSYHVISNDNNGLTATAILDGFTITGGNADGNNPNNLGGGMYNDGSSPTVANCSFSGNSADVWGGGMYNSFSSPKVVNCSFSGNSADSRGGGMYNYGSYPMVTNCSFSGNSADVWGGGMYNDGSSPTVANCSFSGNSASDGGGMYNYGSTTKVTNCILWGNSSEIRNGGVGNPTVSHSIVQGGYAGTGNLNVDPLFVSQPPIGLGPAGDLRLQQCSRAIDMGDDAAPGLSGITTDLDGIGRFHDAAPNVAADVDMGCYEYQGTLP